MSSQINIRQWAGIFQDFQSLLHDLFIDNLSFSVSAVLFFAISAGLELFCVLLYAYVFPKLPIVKYYRSKAASEGSKTVSADLAAGGIQIETKQEVISFLQF